MMIDDDIGDNKEDNDDNNEENDWDAYYYDSVDVDNKVLIPEVIITITIFLIIFLLTITVLLSLIYPPATAIIFTIIYIIKETNRLIFGRPDLTVELRQVIYHVLSFFQRHLMYQTHEAYVARALSRLTPPAWSVVRGS